MTKKNPEAVWKEYRRVVDYNTQINLYEDVKQRENFYRGKQWEGVNAPDIDKAQIDFIHRGIIHYLGVLVSDDIAVRIDSFKKSMETQIADNVLSNEIERVMERTKFKAKNRIAIRNAAVDGDCCFFWRFDPDIETGQPVKGDIELDIVDNTNILFSNPYDSDLQSQDSIIIVKQSSLPAIKREAEKNDVNPDDIKPDNDNNYYNTDKYSTEDNLVTVLIRLWKDEKTNTIHYTKSTKDVLLKDDTDLGYKIYPIAYMSWEQVKNSYHGDAAITKGIIENQIFVNKMWTFFGLHHKTMAFPKVIYDGNKIDEWTNKVGQAIKVHGNPNEAIATGFRAPDFSTQALALVEKTIQYSRESMLVNDTVLGNVNPENTSAIVALQKSSTAPLELQRLANYQFVEDCVRIMAEIMHVDFGRREVSYVDDVGEEITTSFDFKNADITTAKLNINVGSAAYWSEVMQMQTSDNLFAKGIIKDAALYLSTIPDKYVKNKTQIIAKLNEMAQLPPEVDPQAQTGGKSMIQTAQANQNNMM